MATADDYPRAIVPVNHVEPVPRRIRAVLGGRVVVDTTSALYVWEWPQYPQFYLPVADVDPEILRSDATRFPAAAALEGTVRLDWAAFDSWFEEDEEVFVHPRDPYTRVDALRSGRSVRIEVDRRVLAESSAPVLVFETGVPTRYYFDRSAVRFAHLVPSDTVTACPYKGRTTGYWSVQAGDRLLPDLAWSYGFPTRELLPIAGLVAFYNEAVDVIVDGEQLPRPRTHFSG